MKFKLGPQPTTAGQNQVATDDNGIYHTIAAPRRRLFSELRAKMSPESQKRTKERTQELLAEINSASSATEATANEIFDFVMKQFHAKNQLYVSDIQTILVNSYHRDQRVIAAAKEFVRRTEIGCLVRNSQKANNDVDAAFVNLRAALAAIGEGK